MTDSVHDVSVKPFHLSVAEGIRQKHNNHTYGHVSEIKTLNDLRQAVQFDHVAGIFKDNQRSTQNFIMADACIMDCDNERSDNPQDWFTPDKLSQLMPNVMFYIVESRNHMKAKEGKSARPRFHVYFPLSKQYSHDTDIRALKEAILRRIPDFDAGAKDAARFFFGVSNPVCELHDGHVCIDDVMSFDTDAVEDIFSVDDDAVSDAYEVLSHDVIHKGSRNDTLFHHALSYLSRYGEKKAMALFKADCERCKPSLPENECNTIWKQAVHYASNFKSRYTAKKKTLTLEIIEYTLQELHIDVKYNVIKHEIFVSDLPDDNPHIPKGYSNTSHTERKKVNIQFLPLVFISYLRDRDYSFQSDFIYQSIYPIARMKSFNPFWDMLNSVTWDKKNRILEVFNALGISENSYDAVFIEKWLHQCVAMILNDDGSLGNEFVLVFQGKQGIGKTSFFRKLALYPDWFLEGAYVDVRNKDNIMEITKFPFVELGELDSTLKRDQPSLKAFITRTHDTYRVPYGKSSETYERRTSFCGTVNPDTFLNDDTGNRRFVVIRLEAIDKKFIHETMNEDYVKQLWREVYETFYNERGRNAFRLTDNEMACIMKRNENNFTKPVKAETELYDLLDWDAPAHLWKPYTATKIGRELELKYSAVDIGKALTAISKRIAQIDIKKTMKGTTYLLPPKKL